MNYFLKLTLVVIVFPALVHGQMDESALQNEQTVLKDTIYPSYNADDAKSGTKNKKKADKIYDDLGYMSSVGIYNRLSSKDKERVEVLAKIANSFRLNHETEDAEYWYSRFIHQTNNPEDLLHYAQVLQSNGNCEEAINWFAKYKEYAKTEDIRHRDFIEDCSELDDFVSHDNINLYNVESLNSDHLDFIPIPYEDGVVFTSTRGTDGFAINLDHWTNDNFSDLFYASQKEDGTFNQPEPMMGDINAKFHDGVATFNRGQTVMIFTRNNYDGKSKKGLIDLKIYMATKDKDGYWSEGEELPFNSHEFTSCHPTLSRNGRVLYFASNRPGGYGGLDIYKSDFIGGMWQMPVNLGPKVNSAGNELFPFIASDDVLYFASNGHKGLGGLDVFMAEQFEIVLPRSMKKEQTWGQVRNLGKPFNSKRDDFGFYINERKTMGYLTSSRKGGLGGDDIYSWVSEYAWDVEGDIVNRQICVYENGTTNRIDGAKVTITELSGMLGNHQNQGDVDDLILTLKPLNEKKEEYVLSIKGKREKEDMIVATNWLTDEVGVFDYKIRRDQRYKFLVEKEGYLPYEVIVNAEEIRANTEYCLPIEKIKCWEVEAIVRNKENLELLPNAKVRILNKCTDQEEVYTLSEDATLDLCLNCGCEYRMTAYHSGFNDDDEYLKLKPIDCDKRQETELALELTKYVPEEVVASSTPPLTETGQTPIPIYQPGTTYEPGVTRYHIVTAAPSPNPINNWTPQQLSNYFLGDPNISFAKGQIIRLNDVYYNFDKYNIRGDASLGLDRVIHLLNTYPSMHISLESHTDSRGSSRYNERLSSNRAKEARAYIVARGISAERLTFKGFGEKSLINNCADGVSCSETAHQLNRRTEIRITKFDQDIPVEYGN